MENNILNYIEETQALLETSELLGAESSRAAALAEKLREDSITVSVIGQFKRGKSCLVNALLGCSLLPTGIVPVTSAAAKVSWGKPECSVVFTNGVIKSVDPEQLGEYINEQKNPGNILGVDSVEMKAESEFLKGGITLVDTPGIGSFHKNNTDAAYAFIKESDAVIFMLSVDSPINEIEIDILRNTKEFAAKFFFAVNKIDTIGGEDRKAYIDYCRSLLKQLMNTEDVNLMPISAKDGTGLDELRKVLSEDLKNRVHEILEESAVLKLKDIISSALSQIELYWKVLLMPSAVLNGTIKAMDDKMEEMRNLAATQVHELEADRDIIIPGLESVLAVKMNEFKMALSNGVTEIFGMDYHYELPQLAFESESKDAYELASSLGKKYLEETGKLCSDLDRVMQNVLLFRNSDAADVATRIYQLNKLTRTLKRTLRVLQGLEEENPAPSTHPLTMTNLCP